MMVLMVFINFLHFSYQILSNVCCVAILLFKIVFVKTFCVYPMFFAGVCSICASSGGAVGLVHLLN